MQKFLKLKLLFKLFKFLKCILEIKTHLRHFDDSTAGGRVDPKFRESYPFDKTLRPACAADRFCKKNNE